MPILRAKEKRERSLGVKLFLKGERCNSPKCVMVRRPYKPGVHGKKRRRALSEYGAQLAEKQKIRITYGLNEAQMARIFKEVSAKAGSIGEAVIATLERQFSNVVFRLGFAASRIISKQLISHGHFFINGKKINTPSYRVSVGDIISISPRSRDLLIFNDLTNIIKKYETPPWLTLDKDKVEGKVNSLPRDVELPFDINLVVDYYSK